MLAELVKVINPLQSLAARIGWVFGVLSVVAALIAGQIVGSTARSAVEQDIGKLYADRAEHISDAIDLRISNNASSLETAAGVLGADGLAASSQVQQLVDTIHANLIEETWVGVADLSGKVIAGDYGQFENSSVADRSWFKLALQKPVVSVPEKLPETKEAGKTNQARPRANFIALAAPIKDGGGATTGLAVAFLDMKWINGIWQSAASTLADARRVEVFLYGRDGVLLLSSGEGDKNTDTALDDRIKNAVNSASGSMVKGSLVSNDYLLGYAANLGTTNSWVTAVVRERLATAYHSANTMATAIALSSLVLGLGLSLAAAIATWFTTRGLARIAAAADALRTGIAREFLPLRGNDEAARISRSLAALFNSLKQSNLELEDLNRSLDQKVTERTREVQRLSEETRNAAITRERLRLSRDLHDTLAHSMLAMLTQIRLMKKLYKAKPERLAEELGYAEQAAQEGLAKARDAVTELRYFAVRDDGLEQALKKLVKRLKERAEIEANLEIDEAAAALAGPTAETVYRVAEEALHNIEKHADAHHVHIRVALNRENPASHLLSLVIEDDGKGFDVGARKQGHFGLIGMREQADILGANLAIESTPLKGTRVQFVVSL